MSINMNIKPAYEMNTRNKETYFRMEFKLFPYILMSDSKEVNNEQKIVFLTSKCYIEYPTFFI